MLTSILNLIGGSLLGVVGGWVTKWLDIKSEALRFEHEIALKKVDAEIMAQEWAARTKVAEVEAAGKVGEAEAEAFGRAVQAEAIRYSEGVQATSKQAWLLVGLDVLRGVVRPGLTLYLCVLTTLLYIKATALLPTIYDPSWAQNMVQEISMKILWLADVAVAFWFGSRTKR